MSGQRVNLNKESDGQFAFRIEKDGNDILFRGKVGDDSVDADRFNNDDGKVSALFSFNFSTGAVHMMVNGQHVNWIDYAEVDSGVLDMTTSRPRLFADELTARGSNWEGELDLFYIDDAYYDLEQVANIDRFLAADGLFRDLGVNGTLPSGAQPLMFVAGTAAEIAAIPNRGRGGICVLSAGPPTDAT